ncbi:hypothetical protein LZ198_35190 [Myxococcus sp. K15C18031901]|uniref:hypothetical protein n=1 Tax=Myxococcus dinghuensis TaxID=2906761 RepID=UPI0020A8191A|nr:hypothetical protein [Myxococcus dinghuensis]MCP3104128.1 hypothetical protein [Myxococcus dinghuensis]
MAHDDERQLPNQPAEDYYGRTTGLRHEEGLRGDAEDAPPEEDRADTPARPAVASSEEDEDTREVERLAADEDALERDRPRPMDPTERTPGAILDDIPDGDGPRSDAGTNPLPDHYWTAYPGALEEER